MGTSLCSSDQVISLMNWGGGGDVELDALLQRIKSRLIILYVIVELQYETSGLWILKSHGLSLFHSCV